MTDKNPYTTPIPIFSKEYVKEIDERRRKIELLKADGAPAHVVTSEMSKLREAEKKFESLKSLETKGKK